MANIIAYRDIPQNSTAPVNLPKQCHGVLVQNNTNVFVFINNDRGVLLLNVPPGLTLGWNEPDGMYAPQVGCNGFYQGNGRVYFYDGALDISNNPAAQQPPGLVTIGSGTVTIASGTVSLAPGTSVNATNLTIESNTGSTAANTSGLLGLLPTHFTPFTVNNGTFFFTTTTAIGAMSLQMVTMRIGGKLSITAVIGVNNFLIEDAIDVFVAPRIPWRWNELIPAGFSVVFAYQGDADFVVGY